MKLTASMVGLGDAAPLRQLPPLRGEMQYGTVPRQMAAHDWGRYVHRSPVAVLKPASVTDIARIVTYANQHHLKVAMRGQGHCVYGQAQVEDGITRRFVQPLHVVPDGPMAFTVRLQRRASAEHASDHKAMLTSNETLVQRCMEAGGKIYPPFAPTLSRDDWRRHYGAQTWERFAAAKHRFDPKNVLTPGAGVFHS